MLRLELKYLWVHQIKDKGGKKMEFLINPYGTEWHEKLEEQRQPCAECGTISTCGIVLSLRGYADPLVLCDHKCLLKFAQTHYWEVEED